jgi:hypothetical protein
MTRRKARNPCLVSCSQPAARSRCWRACCGDLTATAAVTITRMSTGQSAHPRGRRSVLCCRRQQQRPSATARGIATHGPYRESGFGDSPRRLIRRQAGGDTKRRSNCSGRHGVALEGRSLLERVRSCEGTGPGIDNTGIQSLAAWQSAGFSNQSTTSWKSTWANLTSPNWQRLRLSAVFRGLTKVVPRR